MSSASHWQQVYTSKEERHTSWYRPHLETSLRLIEGRRLPADAAVIDVGAGRATLVDDLLARGFRDLTALDISAVALTQARRRLGVAGDLVRWITGDVLATTLPAARYDLWHDRAVFHFLTDPAQQQRYAAVAAGSVRAGGYLLLATFAPDGPESCSNLPVCRYDAAGLAARFAPDFTPVADAREDHRTPSDSIQAFTYLLLRRTNTE
jgi:trans-aconitate methyltransferase